MHMSAIRRRRPDHSIIRSSMPADLLGVGRCIDKHPSMPEAMPAMIWIRRNCVQLGETGRGRGTPKRERGRARHAVAGRNDRAGGTLGWIAAQMTRASGNRQRKCGLIARMNAAADACEHPLPRLRPRGERRAAQSGREVSGLADIEAGSWRGRECCPMRSLGPRRNPMRPQELRSNSSAEPQHDQSVSAVKPLISRRNGQAEDDRVRRIGPEAASPTSAVDRSKYW